jgi:D-hexose-6-phosphate mutarotase
VEYVVTVSETLQLELVVTNQSKNDEFVFEDCLHTYFEVGDIKNISISGLKGVTYRDKVENFAEKKETADAIRINSEVDRIYLNTPGAVEIADPTLKRKTRVEKQASLSTVVWNPWITKAQQMPDFGNEEYERMVCVESGNVASNQIRLPPGEVSRLKVTLSTEPFNR